jgi:transposase
VDTVPGEWAPTRTPRHCPRRRRGKTDAIDTAAAAPTGLSDRATATTETGDGPVETIRMVTMTKGSALKIALTARAWCASPA